MTSAAESRRHRWRRIIFDHDTPAGRAFDVWLLVAIVSSVVVVMLDSFAGLPPRVHIVLWVLEWGFTALFTVEYIARLWCAAKPVRYARSFWGVVDLLALLPTYVSLILPGGRFLALVRILRLLRVFHILRLPAYTREAGILLEALKASRYKITVFVFTVLTISAVVGSLIYLIEGPISGFDSIPTAMYWAIVTLTTVGYGDLSPATPLGRILASALMILGYGVIAVPTGIVTLELQRTVREKGAPRAVSCPRCGRGGHDADAHFCKECGTQLPTRGVI